MAYQDTISPFGLLPGDRIEVPAVGGHLTATAVAKEVKKRNGSPMVIVRFEARTLSAGTIRFTRTYRRGDVVVVTRDSEEG